VVYTGFEYSGRNLILIRSSDATVTVCGRIGTLNQFTIGFEDKKPQGILTGTGGMADMLEGILKDSHRGTGNTVFENNPEVLIDKLVELMKKDDREAGV
jgi:uncharacterized protein (TIGR00725 family)